jgi:hypothetical protein
VLLLDDYPRHRSIRGSRGDGLPARPPSGASAPAVAVAYLATRSPAKPCTTLDVTWLSVCPGLNSGVWLRTSVPSGDHRPRSLGGALPRVTSAPGGATPSACCSAVSCAPRHLGPLVDDHEVQMNSSHVEKTWWLCRSGLRAKGSVPAPIPSCTERGRRCRSLGGRAGAPKVGGVGAGLQQVPAVDGNDLRSRAQPLLQRHLVPR